MLCGLLFGVVLWPPVRSEGSRLTFTCAGVLCVHVGTCLVEQTSSADAIGGRVFVPGILKEQNLITNFSYMCLVVNQTLS